MSPNKILWLTSAVLAAFVFSGCSPAQKLVGKWEVDAEKTAAKFGGGVTNPLAGLVASALKLEAEFKGDGNYTVTALGQTTSTTGSWRYLKTDNDTLVLMVKPSGESTERELRIRFTDTDHFEMVPPAGVGGAVQPFPFKRIKPA